jgi:ubiquinone/menaquinone biosynthesis C-methylase UbiE
MLFNSPIGNARADQLVKLLELPPGSRVLDAGCGTGEFLLRVVAAHSAHGVGVDKDAGSISRARETAAARQLAARCEFRAADMNELPFKPGEFNAAICIGSTHAFGSAEAAYPNAIQRLSEVVCPGGLILIGEGYWKREPDPAYLKLIGDPVGIYRDHASNVSFAEERWLLPLYAGVSSEDEWDHFEWSYQSKVLRLAEANPDDPAFARRLAQAREWRDGYLRWGRSTMGFGMYLFRVSGAAATEVASQSR